MSVSIMEALQNADYSLQTADYNLKNNGMLELKLAIEQLHNAVALLEKGYDLDDEVEPLLEKYDGVENVPEKEGATHGR